jgi:hypothetical protein
MLINLLPPRQKEEIIEERKWKTFFILGILSLVFLFSLVLVFLAIEINIRGEAKSMEIIIASEEKELETSEIKTLGEKIKLFNDDLAELNDFYGKQRSSAGPLLDIASLLPGGVSDQYKFGRWYFFVRAFGHERRSGCLQKES